MSAPSGSHPFIVHVVISRRFSDEEANALARAMGQSIAARDVAAWCKDVVHVELNRLIELGKRGLAVDRFVADRQLQVGRPNPNW